MLVLSVIKIFDDKQQQQQQQQQPQQQQQQQQHLCLFNIRGLSNFFGIGLSSLMCQNALPSIVTGMRQVKIFQLYFSYTSIILVMTIVTYNT